jgi:hypothetical protein
LLPSDIIGPLSYFQHTIFNKKDFEKLIFDLYSLLEEKPLDLDSLKKTYNIFWPELESKINDVINQPESKNLAFEEPSDREYLKEILLLNRQILNNQDESLKGYINYISKYNDIELLSPDNNDMNHPIKVVIDPIEIDEEGIKKLVRIVVEKNKANIEKTDYPNDRRGVQISIIFDSEFEDNLWKIDFIFHKGNTYVSSSRIKVIEKEIDDNTIWRD